MRLVVLISGDGSNLQAIIDAIRCNQLNAEIVLVVSNKPDAFGLVRAQQAGIKTLVLPLKPYRTGGKSRETYDGDLATSISAFHPDLIILAGWMHILSPTFLDYFPDQVINLHPALPGKFPGKQAIERAYAAYLRDEITHSGVMVHYVIPEVDAGRVIAQTEVEILPDDTLTTFEARMHHVEHQVLVQAISLIGSRS